MILRQYHGESINSVETHMLQVLGVICHFNSIELMSQQLETTTVRAKTQENRDPERLTLSRDQHMKPPTTSRCQRNVESMR